MSTYHHIDPEQHIVVRLWNRYKYWFSKVFVNNVSKMTFTIAMLQWVNMSKIPYVIWTLIDSPRSYQFRVVSDKQVNTDHISPDLYLPGDRLFSTGFTAYTSNNAYANFGMLLAKEFHKLCYINYVSESHIKTQQLWTLKGCICICGDSLRENNPLWIFNDRLNDWSMFYLNLSLPYKQWHMLNPTGIKRLFLVFVKYQNRPHQPVIKIFM